MEAVIRAAILALLRRGGAGAVASAFGHLATASLCAVVAAILITASLGCAAAALWIWCVPHLGQAGAALVVAGFLLALALVALALMRHLLHPRRAPRRADAAPEMLVAEAIQLFKEHKISVLMAAFVAGLEAGRSER
jgi:hypothetical protein